MLNERVQFYEHNSRADSSKHGLQPTALEYATFMVAKHGHLST
jgi:hypothetical protein